MLDVPLCFFQFFFQVLALKLPAFPSLALEALGATWRSNSGAISTCWWLKSSDHQLRERQFIPFIYRVFFIHPRWLFGISSIDSVKSCFIMFDSQYIVILSFWHTMSKYRYDQQWIQVKESTSNVLSLLAKKLVVVPSLVLGTLQTLHSRWCNKVYNSCWVGPLNVMGSPMPTRNDLGVVSKSIYTWIFLSGVLNGW